MYFLFNKRPINNIQKILVIRFSSIGDLTQSLSIPSFINHYFPDAEIHFITREEFSPLLENNPLIQRVWKLNRNQGIKGLFNIISKLKSENYSHIYDAHNNLRSFLIRLLLFSPKSLIKPMMRIKRFLLIRFKKNYFEMPFSGQRDLIKPLEKWDMPYFLPAAPQIFLSPNVIEKTQNFLLEKKIIHYCVLVPSAAYFLKRWPLSHWKKLIELNSDLHFIVLAGPSDHFTNELNHFSNVFNLTGQTSLLESAAFIQLSNCVITNDTGMLHISEQLGKPTIALMGPAPFGFPSRKSTVILEKNLSCRPCSKHGQGPCINKINHECMISIAPQQVTTELHQLIKKLNQ